MAYWYCINVEIEPTPEIESDRHDRFNGHTLYLNLAQYKSDRKLWLYSEEKLREYIEKKLSMIPREEIDTKYPVQEKTGEVYLIKDYNNDKPVFHGEVTLPDKILEETGRKNRAKKPARQQ